MIAAPTNAATIVVGGVRSTERPTIAGWMRWFSRFMYSTNAGGGDQRRRDPLRGRQDDQERSAEEPADLRDEVGQHRPQRGQGRERDAQDQAEGEHAEAHQHGHGDRAAEVAPQRAVHDAADRVGLGAARRWEQPAQPAQQVLAVDQHGDRHDGDDGHAGDAADERAGQLGDPLVGELLGESSDPLLHLVGDLVVAQPAADQGQVSSWSIVSGSWAENLRASETARGPSTPTSSAARLSTARPTIATANPRRMCQRRWIESTTGSRARAISTPMPMRVSIVEVLRNSAMSASAVRMARAEVDERAPVQAQAQAGARGQVGVDPQRRRIVLHAPDDGMPDRVGQPTVERARKTATEDRFALGHGRADGCARPAPRGGRVSGRHGGPCTTSRAAMAGRSYFIRVRLR